jgi:hypothetical protein
MLCVDIVQLKTLTHQSGQHMMLNNQEAKSKKSFPTGKGRRRIGESANHKTVAFNEKMLSHDFLLYKSVRSFYQGAEYTYRMQSPHVFIIQHI